MSACGYCGVDHDREDALAEHAHEITKLTAALAAAERRAEEAREIADAAYLEAQRIAGEKEAAESRAASLSARVEALEGALRGVKSRVVAQDGGPCWCRTVAMTYCVGQPQCLAARAALAAPAASPALTEDRHDD